ncbi:MAG: DUF1501 domain-containing protein, partial [Planctomycetaceae bacterium]|nr:DUF1501 domain-containing protein [Planctomycetaceae bacterium]
ATSEIPNTKLEIPSYVSIASDRVVPEGGYLGNQWDAFRVFNPGEDLANLKSYETAERQRNRLEGLQIVSQQFASGRQAAARKTLHQDTIDRALKMMTSEQLKAFQLQEESAAVRTAYGNTSFGRGCLVARRLVEVGVRSVEVNLSGFDTHISNHEGHITQTKIMDPAIASLLKDLKDRDLLQSTIVLCISEFGRTPSINPAGGRDHWPNWFSCMIAGGGFLQGTVIGQTPSALPDDKPGPPIDPVTIPQLFATIMAVMGIDYSKEIMTPIGRPMRFADATPDGRLLLPDVAKTVIRST